jgi:predicted 3-demethylubiquinone-9 3-methyltransferase (glyoxalase superfamily)
MAALKQKISPCLWVDTRAEEAANFYFNEAVSFRVMCDTQAEIDHFWTGPKAGGPNYLRRFASEQVVTVNTAAAGGNASLLAQGG